MEQSKGFPFSQLVGKEFTCIQTNRSHVVTAADESSATSGRSGEKPYWNVRCPHCNGGVHRFYRNTSNHRLGPTAPAATVTI